MCYQHTIADCGLSPVVAPVPDRIECADCHTFTRYPQSAPDRELCGNCFCEHYIQCEHCNEVVDRDDGQTYDGDDCDYCDTCFDRLFVKCESCDSYHCRDNTYRHNRRNYCESCYHEEFHDCAGCGSTFANDDLSYHEGFENDYCSSCYPCDDEDSDDNGGGECNARRFRFLDDDTCAHTGSLRTYGVELETDKCEGYSDLDGRTYFDAKDDGSINGKEFVSQVLRGDRGLAAIHEFCEKAEDFKVNDSCGYHVHIGVRDLSDDAKRAVCVGYALTESFWFSLVPKARRENRYCRALKWSANQALDSNDFYYFAESQDRYQWFNVAAYAEHKTFEVRLHSGTLEGDKVCNWVKAHIKFVDWCATESVETIVACFGGCTDQERFERMCEIWGDSGLCEFYRSRAAKFGFEYRRPAQLACAA